MHFPTIRSPPMSDRSILGPVDVTDAQLSAMVAELLGADPADTVVVTSRVEEVAYDIPAITTAGRFWVSGTAEVAGAETRFRLFVKHIQSWSRHPFFQLVPLAYQEVAALSVPWRTEASVYRSDLPDRLPVGLSMPRALGVFDIDDESNAVWLEEVPAVARECDLERYSHAARLMGRFATSSRVIDASDVIGHDMTIHTYYEGRLSMQVLPMLRDDGVWKHPLVSGPFDDDLHRRLLEAAEQAGTHADELASMTHVASHGDACPNNLLTPYGTDELVLIDFGFFGPEPI